MSLLKSCAGRVANRSGPWYGGDTSGSWSYSRAANGVHPDCTLGNSGHNVRWVTICDESPHAAGVLVAPANHLDTAP